MAEFNFVYYCTLMQRHLLITKLAALKIRMLMSDNYVIFMVRALVDRFVCSFVFQSDRYCFVIFMWEANFTNFLSDCVYVNVILLTGSYWFLCDMYSSRDSSRFANVFLYTTRRFPVFITLAIHGDKWSPSCSSRFNLGEIAPGAQTSPHFRISTLYCHPRHF
jgi:hypothetical protein